MAVLKEAFGTAADAAGSALRWALCVAAAYAVLFADISGRGPLAQNLAGLWEQSREPAARPAAVRTVMLPAEMRRQEGRLLYYGGERGSRYEPVAVTVAAE